MDDLCRVYCYGCRDDITTNCTNRYVMSSSCAQAVREIITMAIDLYCYLSAYQTPVINKHSLYTSHNLLVDSKYILSTQETPHYRLLIIL